MGGTIGLPTYIVLEMPEPMATKIRRFRKLFDHERASLPAEITITGSCGIGPVSKGQSLDDVLSIVDAVAASQMPFAVTFSKLECFESTQTYYLSFQDSAPFQNLHNAFVESGIHFDPSPFPFTPHCTLKLRKRPEDAELARMMALKIPQGSFTFDTICVYCLHSKNEPQLLHKIKMGPK